MRSKNWFGLLLVGVLALPGRTEPMLTLDLKPFVGKTPLDKMGGSLLLPRGRQVIDGIPFQIDGAFMLREDRGRDGEKKRPDERLSTVNVGRGFECLHLLTGTPSKADDGTVLGRFELRYADGTSTSLKVVYGVQARQWFGPWHRSDTPLGDPNSREVLRALCSDAAGDDAYFRLFHVVLTNPAPSKEVHKIAIEFKRNQPALALAAMSVGPLKNPESQPDTIQPPKTPLPDLRPRSGELARGEGIVRTEAGQPLTEARVRIRGARKFADDKADLPVDDAVVGVEAVTGADGRFTMPPLPDNRIYKLIVFAEGYEPSTYGGLDPKSDPIEVRLKRAGPPGKFAVRGQVVGPGGKPVAGATVETQGVSVGGSMSWGSTQGFPERVITGMNGDFLVSRNAAFSRVQLNISAAGLAPVKTWLPATNGVQTVELGAGAILQGRVLKEGKPLAGVRVGVSGSERSSEVYAGHYETGTDQDGVFTFKQIPPDTSWYLYGIMDSFKAHGALVSRLVKSSDHGETNNLGDLEIKAGLRLAGRVQTSRGEALPEGLKIRAGNDKVWDSQLAKVNDAGEFELTGLCPGELEVSLDSRNWRLASANRSMDIWNGWRLTGLLEQDKADLLLVIEKGQFDYNASGMANGQLPQQDWPQNRPLHGAERSGPPPIILAGQVLDDKTGKPMSRFKVVPGYKPPVTATMPGQKPLLKTILEPFAKKTIPWNELPFWKLSQTQTFSNGNFAVEFVPLSSSPMLRIEAEDYLPIETGPTNQTTSNIVVRLVRGAGPNGVILLPDGKPAEGATVLYATSKEQFGLDGKKISTYGRNKATATTGKDGIFSFPMRAHGERIFVVHPAGWAEEAVDREGQNLKLRLQPWATLSGTLVDATGAPMSNVELALTMPHNWQRGDPFFNYQGRVTTDAQGRFQFVDVPPRRIELQRMIPMGTPPSRGWTYKMQTWLVAQPGTNNLGKVTYDQPPALPVFDRLKQQLGL